MPSRRENLEFIIKSTKLSQQPLYFFSFGKAPRPRLLSYVSFWSFSDISDLFFRRTGQQVSSAGRYDGAERRDLHQFVASECHPYPSRAWRKPGRPVKQPQSSQTDVRRSTHRHERARISVYTGSRTSDKPRDCRQRPYTGPG